MHLSIVYNSSAHEAGYLGIVLSDRMRTAASKDHLDEGIARTSNSELPNTRTTHRNTRKPSTSEVEKFGGKAKYLSMYTSYSETRPRSSSTKGTPCSVDSSCTTRLALWSNYRVPSK